MNKFKLMIFLLPVALIALVLLGFDVVGAVLGLLGFLYVKIIAEQAWLWFGLCCVFILLNRFAPTRGRSRRLI